LDFSKLNSLAQRFFTSGVPVDFEELYRESVRLFRKANRSQLHRMGFGDDHAADEILDNAVWKLSESPHVKDFGKALSRSLKNGRLNFCRDMQRQRKRLPQERFKVSEGEEEDYEGSANPLIVVTAPPDEYPSLAKKDEDDQKRLAAFIKESAKIHLDPTMTAIIKGTERGEVPNAIGKSLGLERKIVVRKLRYLSRLYDRSIHGDITDYIPDGPRIRREFLTA